MLRQLIVPTILGICTITAWVGLGCGAAKFRPESSEVERSPAQIRDLGWDEDTSEMRRARKTQRKALRAVKDYTTSEEFNSDIQVLMADAFYATLKELDAKSDDEVRKLLEDEIVRVEKILNESTDLPMRTVRVVKHYLRDLKQIAESGNARDGLRRRMLTGWQGVQRAMIFAGSWVAYAGATASGAATLPLHGIGKFVVGAIRGERMTREQIGSERGVVGDRAFEGFMLTSASTITSAILFQTLLASAGLSPVILGFQIVNSVASLLACGAALDGDQRAERICSNLKKIYAFFSRTTDWSAMTGVEVHKFFEKNLPIIVRKKKIVSTKLCKSEERSERAARRVHMRWEKDLMDVEGVAGVSYGQTRTHPVHPACYSLLVKVKSEFEFDDVELALGRVIDGIYVDYVR